MAKGTRLSLIWANNVGIATRLGNLEEKELGNAGKMDKFIGLGHCLGHVPLPELKHI